MFSGKSRYSLLSLVALFLVLGLGLSLPSVRATLGEKVSNAIAHDDSDPRRESLTMANTHTALGAAASSLYVVPVLPPATFTVTSNADGGGSCPGNDCTLREAIAAASADDTINFNVTGTITLTSGELAITKGLTISGPGADVLTISGNQASRIFNIAVGAATVSISGLTIRDGKPGSGSAGGGGAILINNGASVGTVNLTGCTITNNDVSLAGNPLGGGIDNEGGTVVIDQCAIINNTATFRGGAIQNQGFGSMTITNSTIAGNTVGATGIGGGIRNLVALTLTNVTLYGNSAQTGGNLSRSNGAINFKNTIIAGGTLVGTGGTGPDISGSAGLNSQDYNLIQNTAGATISGTTTHNITGVSPLLGPLQNNGGQTPTMSPLTGSPVIDQGSAALSADQRGFTRPNDIADITNATGGDGSDIGAVEVRFAPTITADGPLSRQQSVTGTSATIATVSDGETAAGSLTVTATPLPTGITVSDITNNSGTITATVAASCAASVGSNTVVLTVTDGNGDTATANLTVNVASSAVSISGHPSNRSVTVGQSVTFSVTTTGPVVSYQWRKGGEAINGETSDSYTINSAATTDIGSYDVVVTGPCGSALSNPATLAVSKATTSTALASSLASASYGQSLTLTATVSSASGTPTGTVTFKDGNATLGTSALGGGVATLTTASLSAGSYAITASYGGDGSYNSSDSSTTTLTVNQATLTVTAGDKSRAYGAANPAFTASYSGFVNNETASVLSGEPALTTTANPDSGVGSYPITAGAGTLSAANYAFTLVDGTLSVNKAASSTALASLLAAAAYGGPNTLTATVSSSTTGTPTGNVLFFDGETLLGGPVTLNNGSVSVSIAALGAANHSLTAVYTGDHLFAGSTSLALLQTVSQSASALTLSSSANPAVWKQYLNFISTVSGVNGAGVPTGTVTFKDGDTVLGTVTLNSLGRATLSTSALATGSHAITAVYSGNANYLGAAAAALDLSVGKGLTATAIVSSANPSSLGQPITLTATLIGTGGTPTGSVGFFAGATSLGTAQLNGQSASLTISTLSDNVNSLTAVYTGDGQFAASASPALTQIVVPYCTFKLSTLNQTFNLSGGTGEIRITTRSGCEWIATSHVNWLTLAGSGIKISDGTLNFTVAPLTSGLSRIGAITIAGQTVTITQAKPIAVVSAASYTALGIAPGAIVSLFGANLSTASDITNGLPLPTTLAGTRVKVTDSQGVSRLSQLFYVSPEQINYLIPVDTALGAATVTVINNTEEVTGAGAIQIVPVSPGLFTANSNGEGVVVAVLFRLSGDGTQSYEVISQFDAGQNKHVPVAIDLGPDTDQVYLLLFGTGLRNRTSLIGVTASIGQEEVEVLYAGAQGGFEGLDQVNLSLPRSLIGVGETNLVLTVDGKVVNTVRIHIQ